MVLPALLALALAACSPAAEAARSSSFDVHGTVEHLVAPLGIATLRPRFSWTLSGGGEGGGGSPRNLSQVGYSLRVGSCSSGDVASAASSLLECSSAEALQPGRAYTWTVTVKLSDGSAATMPAQRFSTGLQARSDWHPSAEFIGLKPLPDAAAVAADGSSGAKNAFFGATVYAEIKRSFSPRQARDERRKNLRFTKAFFSLGEVLCPWLRGPSFSIAPGALQGLGEGGGSDALLTVASIGWHEVYLNGHRCGNRRPCLVSVCKHMH